MNIKDILIEIINEASGGVITIDDVSFNIGFNTIINGELKYNGNLDVTLNINNLDLFIKKIEQYVEKEKQIGRHTMKFYEEKYYVKFLIAYLFVNASPSDFFNPINYVNRRILSLDDKTLSKYNDGVDIPLNNILEKENLHVKNSIQSVMMETPYKFESSIVKKDNNNLFFNLPEVSYMVVEENGEKVCYVYSILNKENKDVDDPELAKYKKSISRLLYKLNTGIMDIESDEYKEYKNGNSDYYPENISDVSVSAVLSLYIFINIIKDKVSKIKGVPYLPMRYYSREEAANKITDLDKKNKLLERNQSIQSNLTNKFIRIFRRVEQHIDCINIDTYPFEIDDYITLSINKENKDIISNDVMDSIKM